MLAPPVPAHCKTSAWMWKLSSVSLHAWQVVLCWWGGSILHCSSIQRRCRWNEAEGITAVLQGGSWLSKQVSFWSSGWLTSLRWEATFCPQQLWLVLSVCHIPLHQCCDLVYFCRLGCCCLGVGLRHWLHLPLELHSAECSSVACLFQRGLFYSIKLSVLYHVMLIVILLPAQSVISSFCRCTVCTLSF